MKKIFLDRLLKIYLLSMGKIIVLVNIEQKSCDCCIRAKHILCDCLNIRVLEFCNPWEKITTRLR